MLLVSDVDLILEGWEHVLGRVTDIEVIRHTLPADKVRLSFIPELIVVEMSWLKSNTRQKWIIRMKSAHRVKIIAIALNKREIRKAKIIGVDEAILAPFLGQQLIDLVRGLSRDDKSLCMYYAQQLEALSYGSSNSEKYIELISNILQLLFIGVFANPQLKISSVGGDKIGYLTFLNSSNYKFWTEMRSRHKVDLVAFSIQNSPTMIPKQMDRFRKYLSEPFGDFGILINRQPMEDSHRILQISIYHNNRSAILVLLDRQIRELLALKAAGVEPTDLVEDLYQELVTSKNDI